jgi:hypothetical protein
VFDNPQPQWYMLQERVSLTRSQFGSFLTLFSNFTE